MSKDFRRRLFERYTRDQLIDMLINEKIKSDNYRTSINNLVNKLKESDKVIEEVRGKLKLERKIALSLKHPYTVSNIDEVLQILNKAKDSDVK